MTTTEVETNAHNVIEGEVIERRLTTKQAQALDKRIRAASDRLVNSGEKLLDLLDQAARGEIHEALGVSWTAWFRDAVRIIPTDKHERKALVAIMSGKGMSQRAISGVLNVSKGTVQNDQADGQECPPDNVIGLDGSTRPRHREPKDPEPRDPITGVSDDDVQPETVEPEPESTPTPTQPSLIHDFRDDVEQLTANIQALIDDTEDERFPEVRTRIRSAHIDRLMNAKDNLALVVVAVNTAQPKG